MPNEQQHDDENDREFTDIVKKLDDGEDSLDRHGPVSAEDLRRGLEELYARKRAEAAVRLQAVND